MIFSRLGECGLLLRHINCPAAFRPRFHSCSLAVRRWLRQDNLLSPATISCSISSSFYLRFSREVLTILTMTAKKLDPRVLKNYLADDPPTVVKLAIKPHFEALTDREKHYAHHLSM